jgi:hypothetical protein
LNGRTVLIHTEQGVGDAIQFIRYAGLVCAAGGRVVVECQESLVRLFRTAHGVDTVIARGQEPPRTDFHVPLMSLPRIFGAAADTIPCAAPYLTCSGDLKRRAAELFEDDTSAQAAAGGAKRTTNSTNLAAGSESVVRESRGRLRVGVVWSGNPSHKNDRNRSMPLCEIEPLSAVPGVRLFSLQKGATVLPHPTSVFAETWMEDWSATAALVSQLDLVISVDTAVAHLAGALGTPVWTLLPFVPEWRWLLEGERTAWYPSMRLFRQSRPRDWAGVVGRVRDELSALAERRTLERT